ncbi:unnamed protein product [Allacma fusca]|uniref:Large ribosomal subunit protein uL23m n=1 Tax=Allacma fusca TaxID=39272 RepID=A0A8J2P846_9HEXA|nr:unnamed protein product [Allacma fusca]
MSSRLYPLYQKGNPQLRVFLPNFFMKLLRPTSNQPPNQVKFIVSNGMSKYDVENYLDKIYDVKVAHVSCHLQQGHTKASTKGYIIKDDDFKVAYVTLPKGATFAFPDIYPEQKEEEETSEREKTIKQIEHSFEELKKRNKNRPDVPGWFTI